MSLEKVVDLDIRIPFESHSQKNAETLVEVLNVDLIHQENFAVQSIFIKDQALCVNIKSRYPKYLQSGSLSFWDSFSLCDDIVKELSIEDECPMLVDEIVKELPTPDA